MARNERSWSNERYKELSRRGGRRDPKGDGLMAQCTVKAEYKYTLELSEEEAQYILDDILGRSDNTDEPEIDVDCFFTEGPE